MKKFYLPKVSHYGDMKGNSVKVEVGPLTIWYSYETAVAFCVAGNRRVVCENSWGTTTGKHLNVIEPNKNNRVSMNEFYRLWAELVEPMTEKWQ